jgi:iron(III) transport system substrate-binding protein
LLLIPNTVGVIRGAPHPGAAQRLVDYLQTPAVRERLVAAAALDADVSSPPVEPDWRALLNDLDRSTEQMKEIFRR